jgi:hypothetical protein
MVPAAALAPPKYRTVAWPVVGVLIASSSYRAHLSVTTRSGGAWFCSISGWSHPS